MMKRLFASALALLASAGIFLIGCESLNGPDSAVEESLSSEEIFDVSTVEGETSILKAAGAAVDSANAFFILRWGAGPHLQNNSTVKGHASAVAFETITTPRDFNAVGLDMGTVSVLSGQDKFELVKLVRGISDVRYGMFGGPKGGRGRHGFGDPRGGRRGGHGGPKDGLAIINIPFIAGSNYQFEVTGSDKVAAMTLDINAPAKLVQITGLADKDTIDATQDLTVAWDGDVSANNMVLVLAPAKKRGRFGDGSTQPPQPIFQRVDAAAGSYTISAETLQGVVTQSNAKALGLHLSQGMTREIIDAKLGKIIVSAGTDDGVMLIVK
jgi:hypothetical protein